MPALTANIAGRARHSNRVAYLPIAANVKVWKGGVYNLRAGYIQPADDTSGDKQAGIALDERDATGLAAGAIGARFDVGGAFNRFIKKTAINTAGKVAITAGASGSIDTLTVAGVSLISAVVPFNTSLVQTRLDVAQNINRYQAVVGHGYRAIVNGNDVELYQLTPSRGTKTVAVTATTLTATPTDVSGALDNAVTLHGTEVAQVSEEEVKEGSSNVSVGMILSTLDENNAAMNDVPGRAQFTISGSAGTLNSLKINAVELLTSAVTYTTSLSNTALLIADAVNVGPQKANYYAYAVGAVVYVQQTLATEQGGGALTVLPVSAGGLTVSVDSDLKGGKRAKADVIMRAFAGL